MTLILSGTDGLSDVDGSAATPAIRGTDANTGIFFPAADTVGVSTGGSERVRVDSSGNFGVGTSTFNSVRTVIQGSQTGGAPQTSGTAQTYGLLRLQGTTFTSVLDFGTNGGNYNWIQATDNSNLATNYSLAINPNGGNVGIGTISPGAKLEVKGASATAGQLSIHDGTGDTTVSGVTAASLLFQARDTSVRTIAEIDAVNTTTNGTGGAMVFQTRISDTLAERMRINSSGKILFNTTTQNNNEQVGMVYSSNAGVGFSIKDSSAQSGNTFVEFRNGATVAGTITSNGTTTMTYGSASDYRLKENLVPLTGALAKLGSLQPKVGNWKVDGSEFVGFVAHELQEVFPDAVVGEKDKVDADGNPLHQMVDTGSASIIATLTAAIQEQQSLITALTARITALESN